MKDQTTIAAISTPAAAGGIAVIRLSGPAAAEIAARVFFPAHRVLSAMAGYTAAFGRFCVDGETLDEGVALLFRAPHSYTGENVVELSCHGGVRLARRILDALLAAGATAAGPGEFTRRAFENGKMDLTAAESVMALISAGGEAALREACEGSRGALYEKIIALKQTCTTLAASIAAYLENPDTDIEPPTDLAAGLDGVIAECDKLLGDFDNGRVCREGVRTVIAGRPNVGKSALMNLLSGCERSIVTEIAGTTRDVVEETVKLGELILRLADTAGIRDSDERIEAIGIARSRAALATAELVLAVFDGSEPIDERDAEVAALCRSVPTVAVLNKSDLPQRTDAAAVARLGFAHVVSVSALTGEGLAALQNAVVAALGAVAPTGAGLFNARQRDCVRRAGEFLKRARAGLFAGLTPDALQIDIEAAIDAFGELTGENTPQAVIDEVFAKFCIGK